MDKKKTLKEAKATIQSIQDAQATLDVYLMRLESIVDRLEYDILVNEHLTMTDIKVINTQLSAKESSDEELEDADEDSKKKL